jgi:hypothetical protein
MPSFDVTRGSHNDLQNVAHVNTDTSDSAMLSSYQNEIKKLRHMLSEKEAHSTDRAELERLQEQSKMANLEKTVWRY